jgi:hypothetical protein
MRFRSSLKWLLAGAVVVLAAGSAVAQQPAAAGGGGDAQVGSQRAATLSPAQMAAETDASIGRMQQAATVVRHQLASAREARDVVKVLCLNDKLSQIDVAIRSGQERKAALASAVQRNDAELAGHQFTIVTVLRQRVEQLTVEANQCIGEELSFVGKTEVVTQVEPGMPGEDQTQYPPTDPTLVSAPPVCVSCTGTQ